MDSPWFADNRIMSLWKTSSHHFFQVCGGGARESSWLKAGPVRIHTEQSASWESSGSGILTRCCHSPLIQSFRQENSCSTPSSSILWPPPMLHLSLRCLLSVSGFQNLPYPLLPCLFSAYFHNHTSWIVLSQTVSYPPQSPAVNFWRPETMLAYLHRYNCMHFHNYRSSHVFRLTEAQ